MRAQSHTVTHIQPSVLQETVLIGLVPDHLRISACGFWSKDDLLDIPQCGGQLVSPLLYDGNVTDYPTMIPPPFHQSLVHTYIHTYTTVQYCTKLVPGGLDRGTPHFPTWGRLTQLVLLQARHGDHACEDSAGR